MRRRPGHAGAGGHRPELAGRDRAGASAGARCRHSPDRRLPAGPDGRPVGAGLSDQPIGVFPADASAERGQGTRRQRQMRTLLAGPGGRIGGSDGDPLHRSHPGKYPAFGKGFRRSGLCRPDLDASPERCRAIAEDCRHGRRHGRAGGRHQRRAVPRPRAPHPAGRADLHPRRLHHRRTRFQARTIGGASSSVARRNGPAVRPPSGCRRPHPGNRRSLPVQPGRTALPVSARGSHPRPDRATNFGTAHLGGRRRPLSRRRPRKDRQAASSRARSDRRAWTTRLIF